MGGSPRTQGRRHGSLEAEKEEAAEEEASSSTTASGSRYYRLDPKAVLPPSTGLLPQGILQATRYLTGTRPVLPLNADFEA